MPALLVVFVSLLAASFVAQAQPSASLAASLAQHDFLYAGESHDRKIFIVRHGAIAWTYDDPKGKGEISDAVMLSNGNILFTHQFGVTEISSDKKVLWNFDAPPGHEIHTAVPIGNDHVLFVMNGPEAVVRVVNLRTNQTEKEFPLPTRQPVSVHGQFRHVRLTAAGTLLVAHSDLNKVVEYDAAGHELWSFPASSPWGVTPLSGGNILLTDQLGVREINRRGDAVWSWKPAETPGSAFVSLQQAWRLPNGNTVVNNWVNEWSKTSENRPHTLQAVELTPDKQVAWTLNSWDPPAALGPATTIQFLDTPSALENVHFGDIR